MPLTTSGRTTRPSAPADRPLPGVIQGGTGWAGALGRRSRARDQALLLGGARTRLSDGDMRRGFGTRAAEAAIRPIIGIEEFGAGA